MCFKQVLDVDGNVNVFSIFPDLENMSLETLIRQIGQVLTEILVILIMAAAN